MKIFSRKNLLILLLPAIGLAPYLSGCQNKQAGANTQAAPPPPQVTVSRPQNKDVVHYGHYSGTTEAIESVTIRARVEGFLENIHFTEGAMVKVGDHLLTIDDRLYQAKLDEARADLAMRQAELYLARATKTRKANALRDRAVSEVEVIDARAQLGKAEAKVSAAKAAVRSAELDLSYTRIKAPISGRIGRCLVDEGNLVGAGERTELTTIVSSDSVYANFTISERDWVRFQSRHAAAGKSDDAPISVYMGLAGRDDFPYEGRVDFIDHSMDAATGTIKVRGIFANPRQQLLPGLFARIKIAMGEIDNALLVPDSALSRDQQGYFLLVANKDNVSEYRPVAVGQRLEGMRVIESGLKADERVIVKGLQKARPGGEVTPVEASTEVTSPKTKSSEPSA